MNELSIKMKQYANVISYQSARRWLVANQVLSLMLALAYLVVGYYDYLIFLRFAKLSPNVPERI